MYVVALAALAIGALASINSGRQAPQRWKRRLQLAIGLALLLLAVGLPFAWHFSAEWLWFASLRQTARFERELLARAFAMIAGALGAGGICALLMGLAPRARAPLARLVPGIAALGGAVLLGNSWSQLLVWWHCAPSGVHEPIFHRDIAFYLFTLPVLDRLYYLVLFSLACATAGALAVAFRWDRRRGPVAREPVVFGHDETPRSSPSDRSALPLVAVAAAFGVTLAGGRWLELYHLMFERNGVLTGVGWTDAHVRIPILRIGAVLLAALALAPLIPALRRRRQTADAESLPTLVWTVTAWAGIGALWAIGFWLLPHAVQWLVVLPREISYEKPYIAHNIRFTRAAFALDAVHGSTFAAQPRLDRAALKRHRATLDEVRLWDWRALLDVYEQFQEMRLYYEFHDVDIDRYRFGGKQHQVMVSARELEQRNLPPESRTFVNRRFKYTHGYGITMASVNGFRADGLPDLLVGDIPPRSRYPELAVTRPEIYYGERTSEAVIVNSSEAEFDYPRGSDNVYTRYQGRGGVAISNLWRRLAFGWLFDGTPLVVSSYITTQSRMLWRRRIRERVAHLAPFLTLDDDPYIVVADGKLYWIIDGYTCSRSFPYSEAYASEERIPLSDGETLQLRTLPKYEGTNYVRNSVKAVVDAYNGSVSLYLFDKDDPIAAAWARAFPGLLQPRERMPAALQAHVRYPHEGLLLQGRMYAKFHMTDPEVFYNQEDLWVRATENYAGGVHAVEPYYIMWAPPGADAPELTIMLPFTPKHRQVLVGWLAGTLEAGKPPRVLAYFMPKDHTVPGPQQFETKIDQDATLRRVLTLWESSGSTVIRGNVLAIPLGNVLLYVEPIYLRARTAAYPELRLVAVMDGERLGWGKRFDQAIAHLLGERPPTLEIDGHRQPFHSPTDRGATPALREPAPRDEGDAAVRALVERAHTAFSRYLELQAKHRFGDAAQQLEQLERALDKLREHTSPASERDGARSRNPRDDTAPVPENERASH